MQSVGLLEEGIVVKLSDDLYCGADTPEQLVVNFSRVLAALNQVVSLKNCYYTT